MDIIMNNSRHVLCVLVLVVLASTTLTSAFVAGPYCSSPADGVGAEIARSSAMIMALQAESSPRYDYDRMYSPRNDVYFYRPEDVMMMHNSGGTNRRQATSMQDPDYRPPSVQRSITPALYNPRNDVFARQPEIDSAELLVEKELSKIRAKGRYAIENELYNVHGISVERDVHSRDELACLLLKARLGGGGNTNYNNIRRNFRSNNNNQMNNNQMNNNHQQQQQQQVSYYSVAANNQIQAEPVRLNGSL